MVQGITRYEYAVLAGELAQLAHGVAESSHLHLGEAADLSHRDFSCSRLRGHLPIITHGAVPVIRAASSGRKTISHKS